MFLTPSKEDTTRFTESLFDISWDNPYHNLLCTFACKPAECLSEEELAALSTDLVVLGDMLANLPEREVLCKSYCNKDHIRNDICLD